MKQVTYDFATPNGIPGGLVDLTGYVCDSYNVGANDGVLAYGMGVVLSEGKVVAPTSGKKIGDFAGVLLNGLITEHEMNGDVTVKKGTTVGVIKQGRVWGRLTAAAAPADGTPVYLVVADSKEGRDETGCFVDYAHRDTSYHTVVAVNAKFIGARGTEGAAPIEVYPNVVALPLDAFDSTDFELNSAGGIAEKA